MRSSPSAERYIFFLSLFVFALCERENEQQKMGTHLAAAGNYQLEVGHRVTRLTIQVFCSFWTKDGRRRTKRSFVFRPSSSVAVPSGDPFTPRDTYNQQSRGAIHA